MIDTTTLLATLLATPFAVIGLVNLLKQFGVQGKWSALVAVLLAVAIVAAEAWAPGEVYDVLSRGVILGLASAGLYDLAPASRTATVIPLDATV